MKKTLLLILILILLAFLVPFASAHPGKTDGNGGHTDQSTGEYHYHHGYPAHDHYDMDGDGYVDCPYNFEDKTSHDSGNSSNSHIINGTTETNEKDEPQKSITVGGIIMEILECLLMAIATGIAISYLLAHIFILIFGEDKGCAIAIISFAVMFIAAFIWFLCIRLR